MRQWLSKKKTSLLVCGGIIFIVIPLLVYILSTVPLFPVGGNNDWSGFWGGYIGSIIGGIITLYVMFESMKKEKENQQERTKENEKKEIAICAYIVSNDLKSILENLHDLVMEYTYFEFMTSIPGVFECTAKERKLHYEYFAKWKVSIDSGWRLNLATLSKVDILRNVDLYDLFSDLSYYCTMLELEGIEGIKRINLEKVFEGALLENTRKLLSEPSNWIDRDDCVEYVANILESLKARNEPENRLKFINRHCILALQELTALCY